MGQSVLEASTISYSAAISACEKGGNWEAASCLLADMLHVAVETDTISCSAALSAYAAAGDANWRKALGLFRTIICRTVEVATITCNTLISACEKGAAWKTSLQLLSTMSNT